MPSESLLGSFLDIHDSDPNCAPWEWPIWQAYTDMHHPPWHWSNPLSFSDDEFYKIKVFVLSYKALPAAKRYDFARQKDDNNSEGRDLLSDSVEHLWQRWKMNVVVDTCLREGRSDPYSIMRGDNTEKASVISYYSFSTFDS